jgi:hypothetical protein
MPFARACARAGLSMMTPISELKISERGSRFIDPMKLRSAVDHHRLDVQPDKAAAHRRRVHQLGLDGRVRAHFVQRRTTVQDRTSPALVVGIDRRHIMRRQRVGQDPHLHATPGQLTQVLR